jgi:transcriptional antiterminator RfaH
MNTRSKGFSLKRIKAEAMKTSVQAACLISKTGSHISNKVQALNWYVVQSKPREEIRAKKLLERKHIQAYLPLIETARTRGVLREYQIKPLFPGYLFCRFDREHSLAAVRWSRGVVKILPASDTPVSVDDEVVNAIRDLEGKDGLIRRRQFKKNDRIRVANGPLRDIYGIFERWNSDNQRVLVLLSFVNYQAVVELPHSAIEKIA